MSVWTIVTNIFSPITHLIESLSDSSVKKEELKTEISKAQYMMAEKFIEFEKAQLEAEKSAILAEVEGKSFLQRVWRPITMLSFLGLVIADQLLLLPKELSPHAWTLLQLGMGGYIAGRSAEKIAQPITKMLHEKRKHK